MLPLATSCVGPAIAKELARPIVGQSAHAFLNASLTWNSPDELMFIRGWVKNLSNTEAKVQSFDVSDGFDYVFDAYAPPRTAGVTLGFNY